MTAAESAMPTSKTPPSDAGGELGMHCKFAQEVVAFLRMIGLSVHIVPGARGFIENVAIVDGALHVDPKCLASAMLHEAGHLAVVPAQYRGLLNGNISDGMRQIFASPELACMDPDHPVMRALLQSSDPEVTAWAWAAGKYLGLPDKKIIMDDEYDGEGPILRIQLSANAYVGINGLSHAGYCVVRANKYRPLPVYPELAFWLQP